DFAESLSEGTARTVRRLAEPLGRRAIDVVIGTPPALQGACWEALLHFAGGTTERPRFRCVRVIPSPRDHSSPSAAGAAPRQSAIAVLAGDVRTTDVARHGWSELE